ncbi:hypothetical protein ACHAWF_000367, partial [Thalassiosira exigua]
MGLAPSVHDPCLFSGILNVLTDASSPSHPTSQDATPAGIPPPTSAVSWEDHAVPVASSPRSVLHGGVYVDDFVFFSIDPTEEKLFQHELAKRCKVDFMGDVDFFLGTAFTWRKHDDGHLSVHMCQSAFVKHAAHRVGVHRMARVPNMTPWRSGLPIDSIPPPP